jgi:hypothetical protein
MSMSAHICLAFVLKYTPRQKCEPQHLGGEYKLYNDFSSWLLTITYKSDQVNVAVMP